MAAHQPKHEAPLNSQEQRSSSCSVSTSTPALIQEPEQHEYSSSQCQIGNESADQSHLRTILDLSEDDSETPPLLHVHVRPAKSVELPNTTFQQHHSPNNKSKTKSIFKEWWSEIGMLVLSMVLPFAIIILLKKYDNHPVPSWAFSWLNVNSMVAILSTLMRSCLFIVLEQGLFL
jgi:uncharacterized protein DUF3176